MKTLLFVILATSIMVLGWLLLGAMLITVGYVAAQARQGFGLLDVIYSYFIIMAGPAFGGFVATYSTLELFRSKPSEVLITAFIATLSTFYVILLLLGMYQWSQGLLDGLEILVLLSQAAIALIFAKIGGAYHTKSER